MTPSKYTFKTATVPRPIKDLRRAQEMVLEGGYGHHGVRREGLLNDLLKSREIQPGRINAYSPWDSTNKAILESYSGYPSPAGSYMNRDTPGVAFKAEPVLSAPPIPLAGGPNRNFARLTKDENELIYETGQVSPRLIPNPQKFRIDDPEHWLLTPNKISLPPKSVLISQPEIAQANAAEVRAGRFRHLPADVYYDQLASLRGVPRLGASALPPESHVFPPAPPRIRTPRTPPPPPPPGLAQLLAQ